jgi:hypothetical protein
MTKHIIYTSKLSFDACFSLKENELPPVRAYFHTFGREEVFDKKDPVADAVNSLRDALKATRRHKKRLECVHFILASIYGGELVPRRYIDFFGYIAPDKSITAEVMHWTTSNEGFNRPTTIREIGLSDFDAIRTIEENHRKRKRNLEAFLRDPPKIEGIKHYKF